MNPLVKKEIRLLLPSFLVACVLALSNLLVPVNVQAFPSLFLAFPLFLCPAAVVMLALNSFGVEMSSGTFSTLLAQPVSRQKIWQTKIVLLAVALLMVGFVYWYTVVLRSQWVYQPFGFIPWHDWWTAVAVFSLVIFSGGLWTVLLLRQVAAAFWITVLVPGVILMIIVALFGEQSQGFIVGMIATALGLYSLGGLFFARWLFFRAQDTQWTGGAVVMPEMRGLRWWGKSRTTGAGSSVASPHRSWRPLVALIIKEIQLHQTQFLIAGVLALAHLGAIAARRLGHFPRNSMTELVLESFWLLWLVMPLLVGCAAVAEERKNGTHEGQLCLPINRHVQFAMKLLVALALSVLLGALMPWLFEGGNVVPSMHVTGLAAICAILAGLSFYASTLARSTLQALSLALVVILLTASLGYAAGVPEMLVGYPLWGGCLIYLIGVPTLLTVLVALASWNYQRLLVGWSLWRRNLTTFLLSLMAVIGVTTALYHRVWERFTPFEPPHGPVRLVMSNPAILGEQWNEMSVRLPDGKVWINQCALSWSPIAFNLGNLKVAVGTGEFIKGSNWAMVKSAHWELVGTKTDGTLWVSEKPWRASRSQTNGWKEDDQELHHLMQFGNETNWSSVQPAYPSVLLVKNDGTLWRWGPIDFDSSEHKQWPGLRTFTPYRLGTESNWAGFLQNGSPVYLRKTDGSIWIRDYSGDWTTNSGTTLKLDNGLTVRSVAGPGHGDFRSVAEVGFGLSFQVGIRDDGTFRIWADQRPNRKNTYEWSGTDLPIGSGTNWLAVAGYGQKIVTLKDDGSLWLWDFSWNPRRGWDPDRNEHDMQQTIPIRLGIHSDWIAIASGERFNNVMSFAADGSLWYWEGLGGYYVSFGDYYNGPLLDISHKPQFLGNVFGKGY